MPHIKQGNTLLFAIAACHIMYAWHMEPDTIPRGYHRWISARGIYSHLTYSFTHVLTQS